MTILILEENQILTNDETISDLSIFLQDLPLNTEITLVLKTHDVLYHLCPTRKAVPYLKSAEYSSNYWVGEKRLRQGQTLVGGVVASLFMRSIIKIIANHNFVIKGVFLWADLIIEAYKPFLAGWTLIWHDNHLFMLQDGILRISRLIYLPFEQELPAITRYLKRFGYQQDTPITLLKHGAFLDPLPSFIDQKIRIPNDLVFKGFMFQIPELSLVHRLYTWNKKIRTITYILTFFNTFGIAYFAWQIKSAFEIEHTLKEQIHKMPSKKKVNEIKIAVFNTYCRLIKDRPNLLILLRQLAPLMKEEAVATHFHWKSNPTPILVLSLELKPSTKVDEFLATLQSQLHPHHLSWQTTIDEPLKGTLTISSKIKESS